MTGLLFLRHAVSAATFAGVGVEQCSGAAELVGAAASQLLHQSIAHPNISFTPHPTHETLHGVPQGGIPQHQLDQQFVECLSPCGLLGWG